MNDELGAPGPPGPPDTDRIAADLLAGFGLLARRVRQVPIKEGLSIPERSALSCLDRSGPTTAAELAREVQITAQAMGATLTALRDRGLVERRRDPDDGRRMVLSVTDAGQRALENKRNERTELLSGVLRGGAFSRTELEQLAAAAPLLERLAKHI
ncbi:MarR family winged helix-turn-helix transcriptional regulator [Streptomyces sp. NPDC001941]|uniref:MarR family winged helix-turn-helix transcriptional regulator n=1 Tax=Streptomyces sp. NPDC001941 TaxID=3154659 RepID=UPI0033246820